LVVVVVVYYQIIRMILQFQETGAALQQMQRRLV
tara:strand:- start:473 stop:574 length:102 start_codon:yes stop_codon:yes gene_type:complete